MNTPTPEEARAALRDVDRRRTQTAAAAGRSRWGWIVAGVLIAAYGVLADREPQFVRTWGIAIVLLLLGVSLVGNTRLGGSLLRRPVRPRITPDPASLLWILLALAVLIGGTTIATAMEVPHVALWSGLAGGVLVAAAGPWWQRRILTRGTAR
ncbi:hypothetical protein [Micromonospora ureilytica]|uniref:DUF3040 domain-containing protein n=1 Tax=Micromonospora ureilytica TaxID=709868 RepID=A0ABS0JBT8_9ACTN|nr:hypothetical protein [Micromonospora ureilytica]MBG6064510.1 hypothetical protein [Micromonospora ureilytica]